MIGIPNPALLFCLHAAAFLVTVACLIQVAHFVSALKGSHRYPVHQIPSQPLWVTLSPPKNSQGSLELIACFILCLFSSSIP